MKNRIRKEDADLFKSAVEKVTPLSQNKIVLKTPNLIKDKTNIQHAKFRERDTTGVVSENAYDSSIGPSDVLLFKRTGIQNKVFKRLRKGQIPVIAELDLHGLTINKAKFDLDQFLQQFQNNHIRGCVRIIHGKGYRSLNATPVIKQQIPGWLQNNPGVLAYCSCPASDGGTGAIYILMKKK